LSLLRAPYSHLVEFFELCSAICFLPEETWTIPLYLRIELYKQAIPGVPKIRDGYNPAAGILEVTSTQMEQILGVDFADNYRQSKLFL
jgi:hypothetical protein